MAFLDNAGLSRLWTHILNKLSGKVDTTRTINGKALSANITITKEDIGLTNVDNVRQYSADNPPPYPVSSINGQTGAVVITATSLNAEAAGAAASALTEAKAYTDTKTTAISDETIIAICGAEIYSSEGVEL